MEEKAVGRSEGRYQDVPGTEKPPGARQSALGSSAGHPSQLVLSLLQSFGRTLKTPVPSAAPDHSGDGDRSGGSRSPSPGELPVPGAGGEADESLNRGTMGENGIVSPDIPKNRPQDDTVSKKGTSGTPILLTVNYFKILTEPVPLFIYRVDFVPEECRKDLRRSLLHAHRDRLGPYVFDGTDMLFSSTRWTSPKENLRLFSRGNYDQSVCITVKLVDKMVRGDPRYLQFYNVLMRNSLEQLNFHQVGHSYFDTNSKVEFKTHKLELWPSYSTSIRQHESNILMCVDINREVVRQETIFDILERTRHFRGADYQSFFKSEVLGRTVLTRYNNETYLIEDVDFHQSTRYTSYSVKDGRHISYREYFLGKYRIGINCLHQPLLISRSPACDGGGEIVYLVPEFCRAMGLTDAMRNDSRLMSALERQSNLTPRKRISELLSINCRLTSEPRIQEEFDDWNFTLNPQLVWLLGRVLPRENIHFGDDVEIDAGADNDWTEAIESISFYITAQLKNWIVVVPEGMIEEAKALVAAMARSTKNFVMSEPHYLEICEYGFEFHTDVLEEILSRVDPQIVLCILTPYYTDTHSAIQKKLCIDRPVPSQLITVSYSNPEKIMSNAREVAIQMNCKIGGIPWTVNMPLSRPMFVGYDPCRDTIEQRTEFGAMVASLDQKLSRWFSAVSAHTSEEERSSNLATNMVEALGKFKEANNGDLPSHIIVYRASARDGQIPCVLEDEVEIVREAITNFYNNVQPVKLGYIVVDENTTTKFFEDIQNPRPGTVVDDVITDPMKYEFFLVSQGVKQGLVTPTSYNIIHDTLSLSTDNIQLLTYKMTHLYFNCSHTTRVPAPLICAHKLASFVSQSLHTAPNDPRLESSLSFL